MPTSDTASSREEAKEILPKSLESTYAPALINVPGRIKKKTASSYREVESRKQRVQQLEKLYSDMALKKELQKSGQKCKLCEEELVSLTNRPVYKWHAERKRCPFAADWRSNLSLSTVFVT